jgi:hypothetical protein
MRHRETRARQNPVARKRHVDIDEVDVLALALGRARQVERVDLHKHFLIRHLVLRLDEARALVQRLALARALFDFRLELGLGLGEFRQVDARRLALGVALEIDLARHGDRCRHGLAAHVDGFVEAGEGGGFALAL